MRIVFFGTPEFAVPSLRALLSGPDPIVAVVCQPDKPAGRGQQLSIPPVKRVAREAGVPVLQPEKVRAPEFLDALRACGPDLIVVAAYGKLLPKTVLDLPRHGCINVHASLLPRYRGAAPIQWAVLNGDAVTGVTIMQMNEQMDAGDILLQRQTPIEADETYGELQRRLSDLGAPLLLEAIGGLGAGTLTARPQAPAEVRLAPLIKKEDGRLDWRQPAAALARRVRAFNPWPSGFTTLNGKLLKVHRTRDVGEAAAAAPGTVTTVEDGIRVATGAGTLCLDELQLEGRKRLTAAEFARGGLVKVGTVLG